MGFAVDLKKLSESHPEASNLTTQELFDLAANEGVELDDEDLQRVVGGVDWIGTGNPTCPNCGYTLAEALASNGRGLAIFICPNCGKQLT